MHLLANRLSFFFGIKIHLLYFFPPRSSRKNAHSLLRYFGIRGIANTSFLLPNCRFAPETQKRPKPFPAVWFRGDFGRFPSIWAALFWRRYPYRPSFKSRCLSLRVTKKRRIATTLLSCSEDGARERYSIICCTFSFCLQPLYQWQHRR